MPDTNFNHENIKKFQRERAEKHSECKPSEVSDTPWIYALRKVGTYPEATQNSGKWLVFVLERNMDRAWAIIKQATEEGRLGDSSKISTNFRTAYRDGKKVICVYTYDWTDANDVRRIRAELRALGVTRRIAYKSDADTLSGRYSGGKWRPDGATGDTRISKYYE